MHLCWFGTASSQVAGFLGTRRLQQPQGRFQGDNTSQSPCICSLLLSLAWAGLMLCWVAALQEEFFMEQSVDKAISIDEWTGETLSSSMVDDVFYILRMCSYRALDTASLQALTAVLGQLNTLLATNLAQALDQRWKVPFCPSFTFIAKLLLTCTTTNVPRALLLLVHVVAPTAGFYTSPQHVS